MLELQCWVRWPPRSSRRPAPGSPQPLAARFCPFRGRSDSATLPLTHGMFPLLRAAVCEMRRTCCNDPRAAWWEDARRTLGERFGCAVKARLAANSSPRWTRAVGRLARAGSLAWRRQRQLAHAAGRPNCPAPARACQGTRDSQANGTAAFGVRGLQNAVACARRVPGGRRQGGAGRLGFGARQGGGGMASTARLPQQHVLAARQLQEVRHRWRPTGRVVAFFLLVGDGGAGCLSRRPSHRWRGMRRPRHAGSGGAARQKAAEARSRPAAKARARGRHRHGTVMYPSFEGGLDQRGRRFEMLP